MIRLEFYTWKWMVEWFALRASAVGVVAVSVVGPLIELQVRIGSQKWLLQVVELVLLLLPPHHLLPDVAPSRL